VLGITGTGGATRGGTGAGVEGCSTEVARRQGSTYILLGRSRPARGLARLRTPLPQRLMELLPGVDVRIVADRAARAIEDRR